MKFSIHLHKNTQCTNKSKPHMNYLQLIGENDWAQASWIQWRIDMTVNSKHIAEYAQSWKAPRTVKPAPNVLSLLFYEWKAEKQTFCTICRNYWRHCLYYFLSRLSFCFFLSYYYFDFDFDHERVYTKTNIFKLYSQQTCVWAFTTFTIIDLINVIALIVELKCTETHLAFKRK